jgi:hypothetical protein
MKRTKVLPALLAVIILAALFFGAAASVSADSGPSPDFPVHLLCGDVYWATLSDYNNGLLSVDYQIGNGGTVPAYNVTLHDATATKLVSNTTIVPIWMGDMDPGDWNTRTILWSVPTGVQRFITTLSVCSTCDGTICVDGENGGADIKPGSCPNAINLNNNGNVAVGVFSYGDFDATTLILSSVQFAGASANDAGQSPQDLNGDGLLDMVFHFDTQDLNIQVGDQRACLSADLSTGGTFRSCDMLKVISN